MRFSRNRSLLLFAAFLGLAAATGSMHYLRGGFTGSGRLVIITPHGDNIRQEMGAAFGAWHAARFGSAPEIEWVDQGGTSEGLRYVLTRYARAPGGNTPASIGIDLFFGGGTTPFRTLAREGLLIPRVVDLPSGLPESLNGIRLQAPEEGWYGVALSSFGILWNRPLIARNGLPEPRSWSDLSRPEALGWVACVDPRGSGSAHVIYEIILQKYGWEAGWGILTRMGANSRQFTKGASGVLPTVSTGEAAYTVAIDQYAWSLLADTGPERVGFVLPPGETVITPDPAGILKGAPNLPTAKRFLEFLLSPAGQRLWVLRPGVPGGPAHLSLGRMAVLPEAYAGLDERTGAVGSDPFAAAATGIGFAYSDSLTESRWGLVSDALGLWMVDSHAEATRAWAAHIARRPVDSAALPAWEAEVAADPFFRPPAPWSEMGPLAARWKDQAFRNQVMARWAGVLHD